MDVLFVNAQDALELRKEVNGQLILGTLLLQADFDVDVLRFCQVDGFKDDYEIFIRNMIEKILTFEPKAVSFYSLWPDYHIMLRIAKELKAVRPNIYTVFGGPQASATAQETMEEMPYVDYICSGEGENTVVPFFQALLRNKGVDIDHIEGLFYRDQGKVISNQQGHTMCDLNTIQHWDDRLYYKHYADNHENYKSTMYNMCIDIGRGCPFQCTYCYSTIYWKRRYRLKSTKKILDEIKYYDQKFGINSFFFTHDALTVNKNYIIDLCNQIQKEGIKISWKCTSRIDCLDEELIDIMIRSGLKFIELGIETGSPRMQKIINKNLNLNRSLNIVKYLLNKNIRVSLFFMYGFPNETTDDIAQTLNLEFSFIEAGANIESMTMCRFSPGTQITTENIDQLEYCTTVPELSNRTYGVEQERNIITNNKTIFSYLYHLNTPLRNEFSYLHYFIKTCSKYPKTIKYLRQFYNRNDIQMYYDFLKQNQNTLSTNYNTLSVYLKSHADTLLLNLIKSCDCPYQKKINAILEYERDIQLLSKKQEMFKTVRCYDFDYNDLKQTTLISEFNNKRTSIMFTNVFGKLSISIVDIS